MKKREKKHPTKDVNKIIGTKIKKVRQHQKLSQSQLGEKINLPQSTINRLEKGTRNFSVEKLITLSKALNRNVIYFLSDFVE